LRKVQDYILLFIKGLCMGIADAVPGVSGGTIAFITGIYDELLHSLNAIDREAFKLLLKFQLAEFWKKINGNFLLTVSAGVITSLLLLIEVIFNLIVQYPVLVSSFFFGVIFASVALVLKEIKDWGYKPILSFLLSAVVGYFITTLSPVHTPGNYWFLFVCGALSISSMIFPGISGAFILVLLSKYQFMVASVADLDLAAILVFALGGVAGLLAFARLITWVLDHYHHITVAVLAGFMLGSLNKVWPWRKALEYATTRQGKQVAVYDKSILPWHFLSETGRDPQLFQAILMMALGVCIVIVTERIATRLNLKQ
jgi:putative membrane protein